MKSWQQKLMETHGIDRALVYLARAQGRGSKRLIKEDIQSALECFPFTTSNLPSLVDLYEGGNWSSEGLRRVAYCFEADLKDPRSAREYHNIEEKGGLP